MSIATAAGKVILVGEHAVVHGRPAIAASVRDGATAVVRARSEHDAASGAPFSIAVRRADGSVLPTTDRFDRALGALLGATGRAGVSVHIDVALSIPPGGGLGASAAMGVAIARALEPEASDEGIFTRAMAWEQVFHGSPSGVDVATSMLGGCVRFERGAPPRRIDLARPLHLCVGHSGAVSETSAMVAWIGRLQSELAALVESAFDAMAELADDAERALVEGDGARLGRSLGEAHALLASLGLSTPALDRMCVQALAAGSLGAKLTGAGGGGAVIALAADPLAAERIVEAWRAAGFAANAVAIEPAEAPAPPSSAVRLTSLTSLTSLARHDAIPPYTRAPALYQEALP